MVPSGQGAGTMREHESCGSYCCFDSSCYRDISCQNSASDSSGPNRRPKDRAHSRRERSARRWSADRRERCEIGRSNRGPIARFPVFGARPKWATGHDIPAYDDRSWLEGQRAGPKSIPVDDDREGQARSGQCGRIGDGNRQSDIYQYFNVINRNDYRPGARL